MRLARLSLIISIAALIGPLAYAITLDQAVTRVLAEAPVLRGQAALERAARHDQWRRFIPNEPLFQYTNGDDGSSEAYGLSLVVPFPGKVFAARSADSAKATAQGAELKAKKHELAAEAAKIYLDCATSRELLRIAEQSVSDLDLLTRTMQTLYESGHSTQAERIGAELQLRQAASDKEMQGSKSALACLRLARYLGESKIEPEGIPDDLGEALLGSIGERTADQERANAQRDLAERQGENATWLAAPDLNFSVSRNHYLYAPASPSGKEYTNTIGVSFVLPLLLPFSELEDVKRAKAQAEVDRSTAIRQGLAAEADRADAAVEFNRLKERLKAIREKDLVLAQGLVDSTFAAYRLGKLGFAEILFARKTLSDLKSQEIQMRGAILAARLRCLKECEQ